MFDARFSSPDPAHKPHRRTPSPKAKTWRGVAGGVALIGTLFLLFQLLTASDDGPELATGSVAVVPEPTLRATTITPEAQAAEELAAATPAEVPQREVRLHFFTEDGSPLVKVPVQVSGRNGDLDQELVTDLEGHCTLSLAPGATDFIRVVVERTHDLIGVDWEGELPEDDELTLTVHRGAALTGRVLLARGRQPVAEGNLEVHWWLSEKQNGVVSAKVRRGKYSTAPQLAGSITAVVLRRKNSPELAYDLQPLILTPGEQIEQDFVFQTAAALEVVFVDRVTRTPVSGVRVRAQGGQQGVSNERGRARLDEVIGFETATVFEAQHAHYIPYEGRTSGAESGADVELTVELDRGSTLGGVLTDAAGQPLARAKIEFARKELSGSGAYWPLFSKVVRTDHSGAFSVRGLPQADDLHVTAYKDDATLGHFLASTTRDAGRETWQVSGPVTVHGKIVGTRALRRQRVEAFSSHGVGRAQAHSDSKGNFSIVLPFAGDWYLYVRHGDPRPNPNGDGEVRNVDGVHVSVEAGGFYQVKLELEARQDSPRLVPFELRLSDIVTGSKLTSFELVNVWGIDNDLRSFVPGDFVEDGRVVHALHEGKYEIWVASPGYEPYWKHISLDADRPKPVIEAALIPKY